MRILNELLRLAGAAWRHLSRRSAVTSAPPECDVVVYTREGCHLCDEACELLRRHGLRPTQFDVDEDAELRARYDVWVPVVVIDGKERFRGRINELLLKRLLRAR